MQTEITGGRTLEKWLGVPGHAVQPRVRAIEKHFPPRIIKILSNDHIKNPENMEMPKSTFISGNVSTGKTITAAKHMLQFLKIQYLNGTEYNKALFVSFPDLFFEIKNTFQPDAVVTEYEVIEKYRSVAFLVIDDFMSCKPTPFVIDTLYAIINHRYEHLKPTIITSNESIDELDAQFKIQRIARRINEFYEKLNMGSTTQKTIQVQISPLQQTPNPLFEAF